MSFIPEVDVAIVGGGPTGTALALTLCLYSDLKVAVIEQTAYETLRIGEHVSASLISLLDYLQIKEPFLKDNHRSVHNVSAVWGHPALGSRPSIMNHLGGGYLLHRQDFDVMLAEEVVNKGGHLFLQTKCVAGEPLAGGGWRLELKPDNQDAFELDTRFVVDATGRQARVAKRLGANSRTYDQLVGIVAFLDFEQDQLDEERLLAGEVLVESVEDGWWYSAWLPGDRLAMVFMTDVDMMREQGLQRDEAWIKKLSRAPHSRYRARDGVMAAPLTVRPAHSHILDQVVGKDWVAIGDAAAAFDPLSSMGIGHAMTCGCDVGVLLMRHFKQAESSEAYQTQAAFSNYQNLLEENFQSYLSMREAYYNLERRWTDSLFWQRRSPQIAQLAS